MNSTKVQYIIDTIFMNSQNSKISDSHGPLLNLSDKIDLERSEKNVDLSNVLLYYKVVKKQ